MTGDLRFTLVESSGLSPYLAGLRSLEEAITYPIADGADRFHIDHGPAYHPFFSMLGDPLFLLALDGDRVAGVGVGVGRSVAWCGREVRSYYLCDLKVSPAYRGRRVVERMVLHALSRIPRDPRLRSWKLLHGAAMRGERGDVMRSARGLHPMRLFAPAARLRLHFTDPAALARLDVTHAPPPPRGAGADLSPAPAGAEGPHGLVSTAGRKDLRLRSTGAPWPLVHLSLGPSAWTPSWGAYLRAAGTELADRGAAGPVCFAIDERLGDHLSWLSGQGVPPGAACTVYTFTLPPALPRPPWVHLATSEI